jgi:hypothetical protein
LLRKIGRCYALISGVHMNFRRLYVAVGAAVLMVGTSAAQAARPRNSRANTVAGKTHAAKGQLHGGSKTKPVRPQKRRSNHGPADATLDYPQLG